jgi:probable addiction module antidote protein
MTIDIEPFDAAEYFDSEEAQQRLLKDALASHNARYLANALGVIARAKGLSNLERQTGIKRQTLHKSFGENGNPTLETLWTVVDAIGLDLDLKPKETRPELTPV